MGIHQEELSEEGKRRNDSRKFEEQIYTNISKDLRGYRYGLACGVTNESANDKVLQTIADTKGLTTISPTSFYHSGYKWEYQLSCKFPI